MRKLARTPDLVVVSSRNSVPKRQDIPPGGAVIVGFLKTRIDMLVRLIDGMKECDPAIDAEFRSYVSEATRPNTLGLPQREISARLGITPLTLQRWCKGQSLPFPGPRRLYLGDLVAMLEERVRLLELGDCRPEEPSRRRERLRPADA